MQVLKAGGILATSVVIKMVCGLLLIKLFAVFLTVAEFGQVGQYMTMIAVLTTVAGGAQTHGLIKMLSASSDDHQTRSDILKVSHLLAYGFSAIIVAILLIFAEPISQQLIGDTQYSLLIVPVAAGFVFAGFNNLQISALSAAGKLKQIALSQSLGIFTGTVATALLLYFFGFGGAISGFAMIGLWNAIFSAYFTRKTGCIKAAHMLPKLDWRILKNLLGYSAALTLAIIMMPGAHIFARIEIARVLGWQEAGYWQAIIKLSDAVIQVYGTFFNNYVLAILSRLNTFAETKAFLIRIIGAVASTALVGFTLIYLFRDLYIFIFLTPDYQVIGNLLPLQFTGDFFRLLAAIGSYVFLSRRMLFMYVAMEVVSAIVFSLGTAYFVETIGHGAAVYAHVVTYASTLGVIMLLAVSAWMRKANNQSVWR